MLVGNTSAQPVQYSNVVSYIYVESVFLIWVHLNTPISSLQEYHSYISFVQCIAIFWVSHITITIGNNNNFNYFQCDFSVFNKLWVLLKDLVEHLQLS